MRILKNKIAQARAFLELKNKKLREAIDSPPHASPLSTTPTTPVSSDHYGTSKPPSRKQSVSIPRKLSTSSSSEKRLRIERHNLVANGAHSSNIFRNFGRAICKFASSSLATPYLAPLLLQEGIELRDFLAYMEQTKEQINGLLSFRSVLLPQHDMERAESYMKIFIEISAVFVKYFSVNWIFSGKILNKDAHLKFRFKVLRRVNSPGFFLNNMDEIMQRT